MKPVSFVSRMCQRGSDLKANHVKITELAAVKLQLLYLIIKKTSSEQHARW